MALYGNEQSWARLDWTFAYGYAVLCVGCYASYQGAPASSILVIATLLALPNVMKSSPITTKRQLSRSRRR
jgi:hypothetical protein